MLSVPGMVWSDKEPRLQRKQTSVSKIYITGHEFSQMAEDLGNQIYPIRYQFERIVAIARGGLQLGSWMSYVLNKDLVVVTISLRDNPGIWFPPSWETMNEYPYLVVDDIVDSGETIKAFKRNVPATNKFWTATLHWCQENSPDRKPDFYAAIKNKSDWIVYPWEKEETT